MAVGAAAALSPRIARAQLRRAERPRPTLPQLEWQRDELAMFLHFGVNEFIDCIPSHRRYGHMENSELHDCNKKTRDSHNYLFRLPKYLPVISGVCYPFLQFLRSS